LLQAATAGLLPTDTTSPAARTPAVISFFFKVVIPSAKLIQLHARRLLANRASRLIAGRRGT
jgi:hypothetical protein